VLVTVDEAGKTVFSLFSSIAVCIYVYGMPINYYFFFVNIVMKIINETRKRNNNFRIDTFLNQHVCTDIPLTFHYTNSKQ